MDYKVQLTAKEILEKKFKKDVKGYDPEDVDHYLDLVIRDFLEFQKYREWSEAEIARIQSSLGKTGGDVELLRQQISQLSQENERLQLENNAMHQKYDGIKPGDKPNEENLVYIQRVHELENFLMSIGYNPQTLKKFGS